MNKGVKRERNRQKEYKQNGLALKDGDGNTIYEVDTKGNIYEEGTIVGQFCEDGIVKNEDGEKCAEINNNGVIKNANGEKMGEIDNNGIVKDIEGKKIGEIDSNIIIKDENGNKIGDAAGITKNQAAYLYFFKA